MRVSPEVEEMLERLGLTFVVANAIVLGACFVMLFPTPIESLEHLAERYEHKSRELNKELAENPAQLGVTEAEIKSSIAFSVRRGTQEIWLRWSAILIYFVFSVLASWFHISSKSGRRKIALLLACFVYLLFWIFSIIVVNGPTASVLDSIVSRILNEMALDNAIIFARFIVIYMLAPLACVVMMLLLMVDTT